MKKIVLYIRNTNVIGGIETFIKGCVKYLSNRYRIVQDLERIPFHRSLHFSIFCCDFYHFFSSLSCVSIILFYLYPLIQLRVSMYCMTHGLRCYSQNPGHFVTGFCDCSNCSVLFVSNYYGFVFQVFLRFRLLHPSISFLLL